MVSLGVHELMSALDSFESLPIVSIHRWLDRASVSRVKVSPTFSEFDAKVRRVASMAPSARLYWLPDDAALHSRRELSEASFHEFRQFVERTVDPCVWVYEGGTMGPKSPDQLPAMIAPTTPAAPVARSRASGRSGRSSVLQAAFRDAVLARDGLTCVLCRRIYDPAGAQELQAAHVVAHGSPVAVMQEAGLFSTNDTRNGIMLCLAPCHFWYDRYHWWVDEGGLVCATDALLLDPELGPHFRPLINQPLKMAPLDWPLPQTWAVQRRLCDERTALRHREGNNAHFFCAQCNCTYQRASAFATHEQSCRANGPVQLYTHAPRRGGLRLAAALDAAADSDEEGGYSSDVSH